MEYCLRLHEVSDDSRAKIKSWIQSLDCCAFFVREIDASRPHYQGYVRIALKEQAFRKKVLRHFPELVGNKMYSLKKMDTDDDGTLRYLRYLCKGRSKDEQPDVVYSCTLLQLDVPKEHILYWEENQKLKEKTQTKKLGLVEQLQKFALTLDVNKENVRHRIAERYVDLCIEIDKPINIFYAKSVVNLVCSRISPEERHYVIKQIEN